MGRTRSSAALLVACALALSACGSDGESSSDPETEGPSGALTMLAPEPTQGLDPNLAFADASRIPMAMIYETLVERDEDGQLVGSLAESWEVSDDGKTYTFAMRESEFSDGSPVTAADVKFSVERMQTGEVMKALLADLQSVTVVDDRTVEMTLAQPNNAFLETMARPGSAAILSEKAVSAKSDYFTTPTATSGPWSLEEYVPRSHATLTANTGYHNVAGIQTIRYTFSEDQTAHAAALESGSADIANIGYSDVEQITAGGQVEVLQSDLLNPLFWGWDRTKPPFSDKLVRQAVAWAVDREGRQEACWFGTGGVTYGNILRPWDPAYIEINTYQADRDEAIENAKELLDEAGWVEGDGGVRQASGVEGVADGTPLAVKVPYEGNWPAAECHVQVLQDNLSDVGIEVTPEKYDPAAYWGDVAANKFAMYHGGAGATGATDLYLNWFKSGGALTALTTHLSDPQIDQQINEAVTSLNPDDAIATYQELEEWQADELPMLVVGYQWPQVGVGPRVQGYEPPLDQDSRRLVSASVTD